MNDTTKPLSRVIRIDESEIRGHLDELVRGTVEETLNNFSLSPKVLAGTLNDAGLRLALFAYKTFPAKYNGTADTENPESLMWRRSQRN